MSGPFTRAGASINATEARRASMAAREHRRASLAAPSDEDRAKLAELAAAEEKAAAVAAEAAAAALAAATAAPTRGQRKQSARARQRRVSITRAVVPQNQSLPDVVAAVREDRAMVAWLRSRPWSQGAPAGWLESAGGEEASLGELCATGLPFLTVADWLKPGTVRWAEVRWPCESEADHEANCAAALGVMKEVGFKDAASIIKPADLAAGRVLARARGLLWLLMRQERLDAAGITVGGQQKLLSWANAKQEECAAPLPAELLLAQGRASVVGGAPQLRIARFDDPRLQSGYFVLRLLGAIRPDLLEITERHARPGDEQAEQRVERAVCPI